MDEANIVPVLEPPVHRLAVQRQHRRGTPVQAPQRPAAHEALKALDAQPKLTKRQRALSWKPRCKPPILVWLVRGGGVRQARYTFFRRLMFVLPQSQRRDSAVSRSGETRR